MRECARIRRSDAAETGRGRGGSPRSQREQSAAATRGSSADATRRAEGPSPRADSRAAGRLEGVREDLAAGRPCGGPRKLCRAGRALCPARPLPRPARVPSPSRRPPRRSDLGGHPFLVAQPQNRNGLCGPKWILHRQRFMPTLGSPALRGGTWPPRSPPRCFPRTRRGRRCRPGRPGPRKARPPAARGPQARCTGAERISRTRPMSLLAGFEAFFFLVTCLALHCVRLGD